MRSVFKGKVYEPKGEPYWGWIEDTSSEHKGRWGWLRPAPASKIKPPTGTGKVRGRCITTASGGWGAGGAWGSR